MNLMTKTLLGLGVAVGVVAFAGGNLEKSALETKAPAPAFSAKGSDGKTHSLETLTKGDTTVVLYFIGHTCPVNQKAISYYNNVAKANKGSKKVKFIGVIDTDEEGFKRWNAKQKVPYTVVFDPKLEIIRSYKAQRSPWVVVVGGDKNVDAIQTGYSQKSLSDLNTMMAKIEGKKAKEVDLKGTPSRLTGG